MALARSNYICGRHFKENCSTVNCLTDECTSHHVSCPCCDCKIARLFAREQLPKERRRLRLVWPDGSESYHYTKDDDTLTISPPCTLLSPRSMDQWERCSPKGPPYQFNRIREPVMPDRFQQLRALCGYVEDGSSTSVTISQDDATRGWAVRVGRITYHGDTLNEALDLATKDQTA